MNEMPGQLSLSDLLHEMEGSGDWDVEEVLFLTFNVNLGFFEKGILGLCRAMGARVSIIADAGMWSPDLLSMKGAGSEYLLGLVSHPGAFHPKLILFIGAERVLAAVGSGNLTPGGWQYNSELWTVLRAEDGIAPEPLFDLAEWLEDLPQVIRLANPHQAAVRRIAHCLRSSLDNFEVSIDGSALVTNLDRSMLSQLPGGPVDELTLSAPFFDEQAAAVRALLKHFPSPKVTVIVQSGLTVVSPQALARALEDQPGVRVVLDDSHVPHKRYRHAKLIEWRRRDVRQALTGSANLSSAALLRPARAGGNVELALLSTLKNSLWPDPTLNPQHCRVLDSATEIPVQERVDGSESSDISGSPQLLSAAFSGDQVLLELAHPAPRSLSVEYMNNPLLDRWERLGTIEAGQMMATFSANVLTENALLRLSWSEKNSLDVAGPAVPASVLEQLQRRPARNRSGSLRVQSRDDLLGQDLSYLDAFGEQLSQIQEDIDSLKKRATRFVSDSASSGANERADSKVDDTAKPWLWEIEQTAMAIHGPAISGFALGLPAPITTTGWENFDGSDDGDLEADSAEASAGSGIAVSVDDPVTEVLSHRTDPERLKNLRRKRMAGYAEMQPRLSLVSYMGLARLTLCFYCAGNWTEDDPAPVKYVKTFLSKAQAVADTAGLKEEVNALTAVAMTCVRTRVDYTATSPLSHQARRLHELGQGLSSEHLSPTLVAEYTRCLSTLGGRPLTSEDVFTELQMVELHSSLDDVVLAAHGHDYETEVKGKSHLRLTVRSGDPARAAMSVINEASGAVGIEALNEISGKRAFVLWSNPDLYCIEFGAGERWTHYRSPQGPRIVLNSIRSSESRRYRMNHGPFDRAIPDAEELAEQLGIPLARKIRTPPGTCTSCYMLLGRDGLCRHCG